MAFNGGFPATYPGAYFYPYQQQQAAPSPNTAQNTGIIWVSGEAGAKAYLVAPNTTVALYDSEAQTIYLKSADASGMPTIKTLDYTIRENGAKSARTAVSFDDGNYIKRAEFDAVTAQIEAIKARLDGMTEKKTRKQVTDDE